ncbi:hypothetical protein ACFFX0_09615 [Citricoccus parietis]|uniref:Uncharacterized protein n=1 Tax=Citricoccus parietis TaxID=592307 RepID=A0ABV5FXQ5_9MICC
MPAPAAAETFHSAHVPPTPRRPTTTARPRTAVVCSMLLMRISTPHGSCGGGGCLGVS